MNDMRQSLRVWMFAKMLKDNVFIKASSCVPNFSVLLIQVSHVLQALILNICAKFCKSDKCPCLLAAVS